MRKFNNLINAIDKILNMLLIFFMVIMCFSLLYQILARRVFDVRALWPDELSRFTMAWMVYLGTIIGIRNDSHIRIDLIDQLIPNSLKVLDFIYLSLNIIFSIIITKVGFDAVSLVVNQKSPNMGISMSFLYLVLPLSAVISLLYLAMKVFDKLNVN